MKGLKILSCLFLILLFTGCGKTGNYKEGTYFGVDNDSKYTAVVYVNEEGYIKSVFIDAAYVKASDCKITNGKATCVANTKQILGNNYGMKATSAANGVITGGAEWFEQVNAIAAKVVKEQGLDWLEFKYKDDNNKMTTTMPAGQTEADKKYTDSVAGVTMHAAESYNAVKNALDQAKK